MLAEKDSAAFLIALKDVVEAGGGVGNLARARWTQTAKPLQNSLQELQSDYGNLAGDVSDLRQSRRLEIA